MRRRNVWLIIILLLLVFTCAAQEKSYEKLAERIDRDFKKMVLIPNYEETEEFEFDQEPPTYDRRILLPARTSYRRNTDIFVISNFNTRQPNIQVIINLPEPNIDNNLPHYINQMMMKPPKIQHIVIEE